MMRLTLRVQVCAVPVTRSAKEPRGVAPTCLHPFLTVHGFAEDVLSLSFRVHSHSRTTDSTSA